MCACVCVCAWAGVCVGVRCFRACVHAHVRTRMRARQGVLSRRTCTQCHAFSKKHCRKFSTIHMHSARCTVAVPVLKYPGVRIVMHHRASSCILSFLIQLYTGTRVPRIRSVRHCLGNFKCAFSVTTVHKRKNAYPRPVRTTV